MQPSLAELFDGIVHAAGAGREHAGARRYAVAQAEVRNVMAAASKLYPRLGFLSELEEDANFVAEVDRALQRERQSRGHSPIPGDTVLPFPPPEEEPPPRKGRGKGKA